MSITILMGRDGRVPKGPLRMASRSMLNSPTLTASVGGSYVRAAAIRNQCRVRFCRVGGSHYPLYLAGIAGPIAQRGASAAARLARIPLYRAVLSGSLCRVARPADRVRARRGLPRHGCSSFSVVGLDRTTDQVGDCARVGLQHLGQSRSAECILSGQWWRVVSRSTWRDLFHSYHDRSAFTHNARSGVSYLTATC